MKTALYVRHQAKPGKRDEVRRVWEKYVRPRAEQNPEHLNYFYCFDEKDPDLICAFQVYADASGPANFMSGAWYQSYLSEVTPLVVAPPQITESRVQWSKD